METRKHYKLVVKREIKDNVYGLEQVYPVGYVPEDNISLKDMHWIKRTGFYRIIHGHGVETYLYYPKDFDIVEVTEHITTTERTITP